MPSPGYVDMGQWFADVALMLDRYRRENEALQQILLERGMTRAQIRRGVRQRVKFLQSHEEASVLFRKVCEQIETKIREDDALEQIAKNLPKVEKSRMH